MAIFGYELRMAETALYAKIRHRQHGILGRFGSCSGSRRDSDDGKRPGRKLLLSDAFEVVPHASRIDRHSSDRFAAIDDAPASACDDDPWFSRPANGSGRIDHFGRRLSFRRMKGPGNSEARGCPKDLSIFCCRPVLCCVPSAEHQEDPLAGLQCAEQLRKLANRPIAKYQSTGESETRRSRLFDYPIEISCRYHTSKMADQPRSRQARGANRRFRGARPTLVTNEPKKSYPVQILFC